MKLLIYFFRELDHNEFTGAIMPGEFDGAESLLYLCVLLSIIVDSYVFSLPYMYSS